MGKRLVKQAKAYQGCSDSNVPSAASSGILSRMLLAVSAVTG
jgi:hypothetical protein